jgi:ABC-type taurine transport system ATPase subunit
VAIKLSDELIELERRAVAAAEAARGVPYSTEAWRPWLDAAEAVQAAVTAHAAATGQNRFEVEAELKRIVRHPEPEDG